MKSINKILDVIYYHIYAAYSRVEYLTPEYSVVLTMAATVSFAFIGLYGMVLHFIDSSLHVSIVLILIVGFVFERLFNRKYVKSNRYKKLCREKPVIVNRTVSIVITVLYILLGAVLLIGSALLCGRR